MDKLDQQRNRGFLRPGFDGFVSRFLALADSIVGPDEKYMSIFMKCVYMQYIFTQTYMFFSSNRLCEMNLQIHNIHLHIFVYLYICLFTEVHIFLYKLIATSMIPHAFFFSDSLTVVLASVLCIPLVLLP